MFKEIFKNTGYLTTSQVIIKLLFLILVIFIARYLGVEGLGIYVFAFGFVELFISIGSLGLRKLAIRTMARKKFKLGKFLGNLLILKLIGSFIALLIVLIGINLIRPDLTLAVIIVAIASIFGLLKTSFYYVFRAHNRIKYEACIEILQNLIVVGLGLLFLVEGYGLIILLTAFVIGNFIGFLTGFYINNKKFAKPIFTVDLKLWRWLAKNNFPFFINMLLLLAILRIDILMLQILKNITVVGLFGAAYKIIENVRIFPVLFLIPLYPKFSALFVKYKKKLHETYRKSFLILFTSSLAISVLIFIFADYIILLLYGKSFSESIFVLRLLSIAMLFFNLSIININYLSATDKQHVNSILLFSSIITNIIFNLILIPVLSHVGAALASILSYSLLFILGQIYIFYQIKQS